MDHGSRDYVLLLDRSGSMGEANRKGKPQTRWAYAQEAVTALARKCAEYDADGIDVYAFNKSFTRYENTTPDKVKEIFSSVTPNGGTDFVPVLKDVIDRHFAKDVKPTTIVVLTDGEPSDGKIGMDALSKLIIGAANRLEGDAELAIGFIQVGDDPAATTFLKSLDDNLTSQGAKFDIVDTKTADELENMTAEQVLEAFVND